MPYPVRRSSQQLDEERRARRIRIVKESAKLGTSCVTGQRRKVQLDWATSDASDGNEDLEIYERVNGGDWTLVTTVTDPVTTTTYTRETEYYQDDDFGLVVIDYKLELVTGAAVDDTRQLNEATVFRGIHCALPT